MESRRRGGQRFGPVPNPMPNAGFRGNVRGQRRLIYQKLAKFTDASAGFESLSLAPNSKKYQK
jgi:hypothetical protein